MWLKSELNAFVSLTESPTFIAGTIMWNRIVRQEIRNNPTKHFTVKFLFFISGFTLTSLLVRCDISFHFEYSWAEKISGEVIFSQFVFRIRRILSRANFACHTRSSREGDWQCFAQWSANLPVGDTSTAGQALRHRIYLCTSKLMWSRI